MIKNGIKDTVYISSKDIINNHKRKILLGLITINSELIDGYILTLDFENHYGKLIKTDNTDYGLSSYAEFQYDFDDTYEFDLKDHGDFEKLKIMIIDIFGNNSKEINKLNEYNEKI